MAKVATRLVKLRDACAALGCSRRTFWSNWHRVFTDPRPAEKRKRFERRVYADELDLAVEESSKCPAAILNHRRLMGRA